MKKHLNKLLAAVLSLILVISIIPVATFSASADTIEYAMFPGGVLNVTQGAYGEYNSYSHNGQGGFYQNAFDLGSNSNYFAPFSGTISQIKSSYNAVILQSDNKVYWANGTYDYMSVCFVHDNDISDLYVGKHINQGEIFYQPGVKDPGGYTTGAHVHICVNKGKTNDGINIFSGDTRPNEAFYLSTSTTIQQTGNYSWKTTHTHSYGDWQIVTAATCTTAGSKKRVCACGDTQTETIPAKGHTPVTDSAVAATCTATGLTEGAHCSDCKAIITAQQVISTLGHDNQLESVDRGCESVSAVYSCKRCGQIINLDDQDYVFSDWVPIKPSDLPEELIEEKTQTRYRDKDTTYNDDDVGLDGWIYSGVSEPVYGAWSANKTSSSKPIESDTQRITATTKYYNYYHYCCNYYDGTYNVDSISYGSGSHIYHTYKTTTPLSASNVGDKGGKTLYGSYTCEKGFNVWAKDDPFETYMYTYQTRTVATKYYFYKWSDWSDWTDEQIESNETREVETRTIYRYKIVPAGHTTSDWITDTPAQPGVAGSKHKECTVCHTVLETESIPALQIIDENAPQIVIESKKATAGKTVEVKVALKNNPGVASLKLKVAYDSDLTLTGITYNGEIGGNAQQPQTLLSPVVLNWFNGETNSTGDFVFATLTFKVNDNATTGAKNITLTYNPKDVYNIAENDIEFAVVSGGIEVSAYTPGDINDDGEVNNKDLTRLFQYLSEWDVEVNEAALDINGDGDINNKDLTRLFQYLSEWEVEIF